MMQKLGRGYVRSPIIERVRYGKGRFKSHVIDVATYVNTRCSQ